MAEYKEDFEWEPIEFTTDQGYVLTSFIVKKIGHDMGNPPVLVHHGNGQDAASWIEKLTPENPRFNDVEVQVPIEPEETVEEEPAEPEAEPEAEATTDETNATEEPAATDENSGDGE